MVSVVAAWPTVALGEVLKLDIDAVSIDASAVYPIAGVYSFGRGLLARQPLSGSETTYKVFHRLHKDQFVMSQLKAWEGALARVTASFDGWFLSPQFPTFRANSELLDIGFLDWYCKQSSVWGNLRDSARGMGARRDSVSPARFLNLNIPLPPLDEQRRIVARIEALAARIAEARGLRQAALAEAEALFGTAVSATFSQGDEDGWTATVLGNFVVDDCYGTSEKTSDDALGTPILRMGNIQSGSLDLHDLKYLQLTPADRAKYLLQRGDILVNRTNSAELVGKCAVFDADIECGFASYLIRLRLDNTRADPALVAMYINSPRGRLYMFSERKQMTGQANVNASTLKAMPISLPPLHVQREKLAHLQTLHSQLIALKRHQAEATAELDALLPSLLDKAFRGEL